MVFRTLMNVFQIFLRNLDYLSMFLADKTIRILCIYPAASRTRSSRDINNTRRHHEVAPALVSVRTQRLNTIMLLFPW